MENSHPLIKRISFLSSMRLSSLPSDWPRPSFHALGLGPAIPLAALFFPPSPLTCFLLLAATYIEMRSFLQPGWVHLLLIKFKTRVTHSYSALWSSLLPFHPGMLLISIASCAFFFFCHCLSTSIMSCTSWHKSIVLFETLSWLICVCGGKKRDFFLYCRKWWLW